MLTDEWPLDTAWKVCEKYSKFKLPIYMTEMTVLSGNYMDKGDTDHLSHRKNWNTTEEGEQKQAEYLEKFYTVLFSHPDVEAIIYFSLTDKNAWMGSPTGLLRKDMSPKPAYDKLHHLMKNKWNTRAKGDTDDKGVFSFRGFYGRYTFSTLYDGKQVDREFVVEKGKGNEIEIMVGD